MITHVRSIAALAVALAMAAVACGGDSSADSTTTTSPTTTTVVATTTTAPVSTATSSTVPLSTTTTLPGDPLDIGPNSGDVLTVVGVAFDDVLNLRAGPGTEFEVLTKLAPRADRVISNGRTQALPDSIWYEVTAAGVTGWSSASYLAHAGATDDITAGIVDLLDGSTEASSMEVLGEMVADTYPEDDKRLRVRMSGAPSVGDLGEVIYDVVGFADDSVYGVRLYVYGQPTDGGGFDLKSVEATALCRRGVTADGFCV